MRGFKHKFKTDKTKQKHRRTQNAMDTNQQHTEITTTQNQYGKPSFFETHFASSWNTRNQRKAAFHVWLFQEKQERNSQSKTFSQHGKARFKHT
jgi:hypothetical protein